MRDRLTGLQRLIGRRSMGEFNDRVYETVRRVPRGQVAAYGQIARLIGPPRKARFVGYAMHGNPDPWACAAQTGIPCHRVVFKDGSLAPGFAFGGPDEQRARLAAEGGTFVDDGRVAMRACQWDGRDVGDADGDAACGDQLDGRFGLSDFRTVSATSPKRLRKYRGGLEAGDLGLG